MPRHRAASRRPREQPDDARRHLVLGHRTPDELRRALRLQQGAVRRLVAHLGRARRGPGPGALLGHGGVEARPVDLDPGVMRQLLGQLDREAVGVVQGEGHVASEHLLPGGERLFQPPEPRPQGAVEAGLLALEHARG